MASDRKKETGFHPADADYTRGRGQALADAERNCRKADWRDRKAMLTALRARKGGPA